VRVIDRALPRQRNEGRFLALESEVEICNPDKRFVPA
jgi:hypothetical protein